MCRSDQGHLWWTKGRWYRWRGMGDSQLEFDEPWRKRKAVDISFWARQSWQERSSPQKARGSVNISGSKGTFIPSNTHTHARTQRFNHSRQRFVLFSQTASGEERARGVPWRLRVDRSAHRGVARVAQPRLRRRQRSRAPRRRVAGVRQPGVCVARRHEPHSTGQSWVIVQCAFDSCATREVQRRQSGDSSFYVCKNRFQPKPKDKPCCQDIICLNICGTNSRRISKPQQVSQRIIDPIGWNSVALTNKIASHLMQDTCSCRTELRRTLVRCPRSRRWRRSWREAPPRTAPRSRTPCTSAPHAPPPTGRRRWEAPTGTKRRQPIRLSLQAPRLRRRNNLAAVVRASRANRCFVQEGWAQKQNETKTVKERARTSAFLRKHHALNSCLFAQRALSWSASILSLWDLWGREQKRAELPQSYSQKGPGVGRWICDDHERHTVCSAGWSVTRSELWTKLVQPNPKRIKRWSSVI